MGQPDAAQFWVEKLGLIPAMGQSQGSIGQIAPTALDCSAVALDPAALDASFHLAALHSRGALCVPASIGACLGKALGDISKGGPMWAGSIHSLQGSSTTSSSFLQHSSGTMLGTVQELLAKPMHAIKQQQHRHMAQPAANLLYETVWQVADAAPSMHSRAQHTQHGVNGGSVMAALHATAVLQQTAHRQHLSCCLQTGSSEMMGMPTTTTHGHAHMLTALAKSAELEHKGLVAASVMSDSLTAGFNTGMSHKDQLQIQSATRQNSFMPEEAVSAGARLLPKLLESQDEASMVSEPFQFMPQPRGALQNLTPVPKSIPRLQPGSVWLQTHAVGVNFRDVLNVLGMYPGDPGAPGGDFAGTVTTVNPAAGTHSSDLSHAVFGLAPGCLGSHVQAHEACVAPKPAHVTFSEAASIPTVYITAHTAFRQAMKVQPHSRVLVHAAAGGVGLAAVQVLAHLQVETVASAGGPMKRTLLRQQGIQHVLDSRSLSIASSAAQLGGVEAVLNSLTSPGMVAGSLAGVGVGGAFVEISKRDIWSPARLAQDRPDLHYTLLAVDFLPPSAVHSALTRAAAAVSQGTFQPLPQILHGLNNSQNALRQMSQARHVGKVVAAASGTAKMTHHSSQAGSWVITGGLGSLGSLTANWLSEQGQERLLLVGRTGRVSPGNALCQQLMQGSRAEVTLTAADMASAEVGRALLLGRGNFLSGVMHAAGIPSLFILHNEHDALTSVLTSQCDPVLDSCCIQSWCTC